MICSFHRQLSLFFHSFLFQSTNFSFIQYIPYAFFSYIFHFRLRTLGCWRFCFPEVHVPKARVFLLRQIYYLGNKCRCVYCTRRLGKWMQMICQLNLIASNLRHPVSKSMIKLHLALWSCYSDLSPTIS